MIDFLSYLSFFIINGSDLVNRPWNTTFSPYIHLFGQGWLVIPIAFIGASLFIKTRDTAVLSVYMMVTGVLMLSGSLVLDLEGSSFIFLIFTVLGVAVLLYHVFYGGK